MTTIATDGKTIAADGQRSTVNGCIVSLDEKKLCVRCGAVFAFTGSYPHLEPVVQWWLAGHDPVAIPKLGSEDGGWTLIVVDATGVRQVSSTGVYPERMPSMYAWGSDAYFAMGAMRAGASPRRAIELCCGHDVWTGGEIMEIDIAEALSEKGPAMLLAAAE